jgi:hypothetical protein
LAQHAPPGPIIVFTEDQYRKLCQVCDALLAEGIRNEARVANAWLHVVREHPVFLERYAGVFKTDSSTRLSEQIKPRARSLAIKAHQWARTLFAVPTARHATTTVDDPCDVLFVSHALTPEHAGREDDFYFGSLPRLLAQDGVRTAIALINHSQMDARALTKRWGTPQVSRHIFDRTLLPQQELTLRRLLRRDAAELRTRAAALEGVAARIARQAASEATSSGSISSLRLRHQVQRLVADTRPRVLVTTFEGHGWERLAYAAARAASHDVLTVGYQHAALFRLQHAIRRPLGAPYDPDVILTAGDAALRIFHGDSRFTGTSFDVLGSDRGVVGTGARVGQQQKTRTCLVMPEGYDDECKLLFSYSLGCALQVPDVKFLWRLHPQMSLQRLSMKLPFLRSLPSNIEVSSRPIDDDIAESQWVLYRGTTAVIKAIGYGCRPLYLAVPGELSIDPLALAGGAVRKVCSVPDFLEAIRKPPNPADEQQVFETSRAMFSPWHPEVLRTIVNRHLRAAGHSG